VIGRPGRRELSLLLPENCRYRPKPTGDLMSQPGVQPRSTIVKVVAASMAGTTVEWYDFCNWSGISNR